MGNLGWDAGILAGDILAWGDNVGANRGLEGGDARTSAEEASEGRMGAYAGVVALNAINAILHCILPAPAEKNDPGLGREEENTLLASTLPRRPVRASGSDLCRRVRPVRWHRGVCLTVGVSCCRGGKMPTRWFWLMMRYGS